MRARKRQANNNQSRNREFFQKRVPCKQTQTHLVSLDRDLDDRVGLAGASCRIKRVAFVAQTARLERIDVVATRLGRATRARDKVEHAVARCSRLARLLRRAHFNAAARCAIKQLIRCAALNRNVAATLTAALRSNACARRRIKDLHMHTQEGVRIVNA